ncbi:hypothetical protein BGZ67_000262 [Mortierella alpina]|nr:hypothetical protein BGZ67_000262 [Mortierella alpina]
MLSLLMSAEDKARLWDTSMEDISMFHGQSNITHILWNHSGSYFTSIDEKGKIVIWANKRYLNAWLPVYMIVLFNPVVCCEWINPERMYVASKSDSSTKYERERTRRPRNPMALVVLSSDGQLTTLFKPAGQYFSHISTTIPRRSFGEDLTSSRISHGSMMSSVDGIHLATHVSNVIPSTVNLYQIDLQFTPDVVFRCDSIALLHISNPLTGPGSIMTPGIVQQLQLLPQTPVRPYAVAVALASMDEMATGERTYKSQVVVWEVTPKLLGFHTAFQELSTRRNDAVSGQPSLTFVMVGERQFKDKFVSAMSYIPRSRELVVGFSDGSVLGLESRFSGLMDATPTLLEGFSKDKDQVPVVAIHPSPNGFALMYSSLSGRISSLTTSESSEFDLDLDSLIQQTVLALLNEWDYSDIVSVIIKSSRVADDDQLVDRFMEGIFKSYDAIKGAEDSTMLEPFMPRASVMRRMLSLQLVLFQAFPNKIVQYRATCALLHLQSIGEVFMGCCTSDPATLATHLDQGANVAGGQAQLSFDTDSLWSLFPLCGWVLDFCTILFRELAVFLNMKTASSNTGASSPPADPHGVPEAQSPTSAALPAATPTPSLLCFLYHSRARKTLRSVLILLEQYHQYIRIREQLYVRVVQSGGAIEANAGPGQERSNNHTNSMSIPEAVALKEIQIAFLSQYVEAAFSRSPIKIGVVKSMIRDLNGIGNHVDLARTNGATGNTQRLGDNGSLDKSASDHAILIKGTVPSTAGSSNNSTMSLAQAKTELRMIIRRYPTLWDMNRLIFATIHWLDLEPAGSMTWSRKGSRHKTAAMHPSRCRIDPVSALKTRPPAGAASSVVAGLGGRVGPHASLTHHASNVSSSNMSVGSRGSFSSASGKPGIPGKVFTESPGELPLSQQSSQQLRAPSLNSSFQDVSSTLATSGSISHGSHLDVNNVSSHFGPLSLWGLVDEDEDDEGDERGHPKDEEEDKIEHIKSIWSNWTPALLGQAHGSINGALKDSHNENGVEMVPDDDTLLEEEEDDEDGYSDEDMRSGPVDNYGNSRRSSKGNISRNGGTSRRSSLTNTMMTTLAPISQWLLHESQTISQRTQSEWTSFPVLSNERPCTGNGLELRGDTFPSHTSRLALAGLLGHFTPLDLQPTERSRHTQSEIETQVRKRRFGIDPIRKVKKYKTTGNGRQCIRCLQISTNNTITKAGQRRSLPHQIGSSPAIIPDIASATLWYHNYDRSCICGGMWLEL